MLESNKQNPHAIERLRSGERAEQTGSRDDAEQCYREALAVDPRLAVAHFRLGNLLCDSEEDAAAEECYLNARGLRPDVADVHNNLGTLYKDRGEFSRAEACFTEAVARDWDSAEAHNNLGTVLQIRGKLVHAAGCFHRAIDANAGLVGAHINLGNLLADCGDVDRAVDCFETALSLDPQSREARFNRALAKIRAGRLREGWSEYPCRFGHKVAHRTFAHPDWIGPGNPAANLLVYAEQGVGDEIMFASCLPDAISQSRHCFVECDPRLTRLLARSFPAANVIARPCDRLIDRDSVFPQIDAQVAMGSLPLWFRSDMNLFPCHTGYLIPDPDAIAKWKTRFDEAVGRFTIGIAWRGGTETHVKRQRSTRLKQWKPLFAIPNLSFVNLQYGDCRAERSRACDDLGVTIHDWDDSDPMTDLDDFAAKISAVDLVISIDNSTVHFAGALGVPVWTLLPFSADFRWFPGGGESPWYPSMKLFRQTTPSDWDAVFRRVAEELESRRHPISAPHFSASVNDPVLTSAGSIASRPR